MEFLTTVLSKWMLSTIPAGEYSPSYFNPSHITNLHLHYLDNDKIFPIFRKKCFLEAFSLRKRFGIHLKTPCRVNKTNTYFSNKKWIIYPPNASKGTERILSSFIAMTTFSTLLCVKNLNESLGRHWKFESVRGNCPMAVVLTDAGSLSIRRNGNARILVFAILRTSLFSYLFLCCLTLRYSLGIPVVTNWNNLSNKR